MGRFGKHSILGANARHLTAKYNLSYKTLENEWRKLCSKQIELIRVSEQIKELNYTKCIIDMLCTA